jgi:LysM repeat protein
MSEPESNASDVIEAYRRRRERLIPFLLGGLAVVLLVVGIFLIVIWLTGENAPALPFFATDTPTPTQTFTPLPATSTPTITLTPEPTLTATPSGPISYIVEAGDTLSSIAEEFGIDVFLIIAFNSIDDPDNVPVGRELLIPLGDAELPTETPLPENLPRGFKIQYLVKPGDSLQTIAAKFNSTAEAIAKENKITDPNKIEVGDMLLVPINIATPTPTSVATATRVGTAAPSPTPTSTPRP